MVNAMKCFCLIQWNIKFNKKLRKKFDNDFGKTEYPHYDNYDAIEVPFTECIPSDYDGVMGVPITFIDKYNPNQFEIMGNEYSLNVKKGRVYVNGKRMYGRIFIRHKKGGKSK